MLRSFPLEVYGGRLETMPSESFAQASVPTGRSGCRIPAGLDEIGRLEVCRIDVREVAGSPVVGSPCVSDASGRPAPVRAWTSDGLRYVLSGGE